MNNPTNFFRKGISTPVGILIIVLVALIAGGIVAWRYFGAPKETVTKDETADWKIYRNDGYGFKIKYPNDWIATSEEGTPIVYLYPTAQQFGAGFEANTFISIREKEPDTLGFRGTFAIVPYSSATDISSQLILSKDIIVNNILFKKDYWIIYTTGKGNLLAAVNVYAKHDGKYYTISRGLDVGGINGIEEASLPGNKIKDKEVINEILRKITESKETIFLDQMLSTFKFLE